MGYILQLAPLLLLVIKLSSFYYSQSSFIYSRPWLFCHLFLSRLWFNNIGLIKRASAIHPDKCHLAPGGAWWGVYQ